MSQESKKESDIDIIGHRFNGVKNGYSTIEVDIFLDKLLAERNAKNIEYNELKTRYESLLNEFESNKKQLKSINDEFNQMKLQYKNIKPSDFVDNATRIDDIKKINAYEKKLIELGVDPKSIK